MVGPVIASSMAFMLPAATPPNAIAFSYGRLKVLDLVRIILKTRKYIILKVILVCFILRHSPNNKNVYRESAVLMAIAIDTVPVQLLLL